jgi:hypothetical protein
MPRRLLFIITLSFMLLFALLVVVGGASIHVVQASPKKAGFAEGVHSPTVCVPSIIVTSTLDSGVGTLRQAIADVCAGGTIAFNGDTIITLTSELVISQSLSIDGGSHQVVVSGNHTTRVFNITGGNITFTHLTIADGNVQTTDCSYAGSYKCGGGIMLQNSSVAVTVTYSTLSSNSADGGGGIYSWYGTLQVQNSTVSSNTANCSGCSYSGGGILVNGGTATIQNSTLSGNSTNFYGGGILSYGTLTVQNSTVSSNTAQFGGGIFVDGGTATIQNSTLSDNTALSGGGIVNYGTLMVRNSALSGNTANDIGGGIENIGTLTVQNSTLSGNSAARGSGIDNEIVTLHLSNTILANSPSGGDCINFGTIATNDHNLIKATGSNACGLTNGAGGSLIGIDPLLSSLGNYGGSTPTFALLPGSPAIDAGNNATCLAIDQRGAVRPQGAACDIGAFESHGFMLTKASGDNQSAAINGTFAQPLVISVTSAYTEPVNGGVITFVGPSSGASTNPITATATISNSAASDTVTANGSSGIYTVTAGVFGATTSVTFTLTNLKGNTTTSVTAAPNPAAFGEAVTFTAIVISPSGTPSGSITFTLDTFNVNVSLDVNGQAVYVTNALAVGTHAVTATYSGAANFIASSGELSGGVTIEPVKIYLPFIARNFDAALTLCTDAVNWMKRTSALITR